MRCIPCHSRQLRQFFSLKVEIQNQSAYVYVKQNTRQEGQRKKGEKRDGGGGGGRGYRYVTIMQRFTDLLITHRPMRLRNSIGRRWTTTWIDHRVRCTRVREKASAVKNCVAADPIGVEGNLCGSGRYRAKVEAPVEGRTETGEEEFRSPSLDFEVDLCTRGAIASGSIYFFLLSFSVPLLISYVFTRALLTPTSSSSRDFCFVLQFFVGNAHRSRYVQSYDAISIIVIYFL